MSDESKGQEDSQVQTEGTQLEGVPTSDKPADLDEQEALENSKNPERTKEYIEKLKAENKRLKEQGQSSQPKKSVLDMYPDESLPDPIPQTNQNIQMPQYQQGSLQTPSAQNYENLNQNQVNSIMQGLIDSEGYIDPKALEQRLNAANEARQQANEALKKAQQLEKKIEQHEQTRETKALYKQFPQLNPDADNFNEKFYDSVRNEIFAQYMSGQKRDAIKAAEKYADVYVSNKKAESQAAGGLTGTNRTAPPATQTRAGIIRSHDDFASRISAYEQSIKK